MDPAETVHNTLISALRTGALPPVRTALSPEQAGLSAPELVGMFQSQVLGITASVNWNVVATMFAGTGVIFAAVYLLWMVQRVFFGKITNAKNRMLADLSYREIGLMVPLLFLMVFMGVYPRPFLDRTESAVTEIQKRVLPVAGGVIAEAEK